MKKNTRLNLPLSYSVAAFDSDRFVKLRVKVMHSGLNLNGSTFDSAAIEKAQSSIANIPLLAFVKKQDGEETVDFGGHEFEIKISENGIRYVYLGRPIGIVPESNNYSFELDEETGKMFVFVDAYVWRDYANEALDIIEKDEAKKVSMEIRVNDYDETETATFNITDYSYTGIAILGNDVQEAMIGAKAEIAEFSETKQALLELIFSLKEELNKEFETTTDENTQENEEFEIANNEDTTVETENVEIAVEEEDFQSEEPSIEVESEENNFETAKAIETADVENVDFESQITELQSQISSLQAQISEFETENAALKVTIAEFEISRKEELLQEFEEFAELQEYSTIKEKAIELDYETLKLQLFALKGQHVQLTPVQKLVYNHIGGESSASNEPSWAQLVKKRS